MAPETKPRKGASLTAPETKPGRKPRIEAFDYMKAFSMIVVIFDHFGVHVGELEGQPFLAQRLQAYVNGSWEVAIMMFLMTSGALCWYNHPRVEWKDLGSYYKKRFVAIFPSFYIVWFLGYLENVLQYKSLLYVKPGHSILLSFIGMDGYLGFLGDNYYVAGEWFFGMIVLLYLLYPFVARVFAIKVLRFPIEAGLVIGTYLVYHHNIFGMLPARNIVTCLLAFWTGMILISYYKKLINLPAFLIAAVVAYIILFVPFNRWEKETVFFEDILGAAFFILMACISEKFPKIPGLSAWAKYTSAISLQMLLMQHMMVLKVLSNFAGMYIGHRTEVALLLFTVFLVYLTADMLFIVTEKVVERVGKWSASLPFGRKSTR